MLTFISGGVRSGKSALGERLVTQRAMGRKVYLATAEITDGEMETRVARHRKDRAGKGFVTMERSRGVAYLTPELSQGDSVLVDCLGTLVANEMFADGAAAETVDSLVQRLFSDIMLVNRSVANLVVVSNEVFSDGVQYDSGTEAYIEALGRLHCLLAAEAGEALECACGLTIKHKG